jgi:putative transposase
MPHEYRKLSDEQRQALVQQRRSQGFPLHGPPHPYQGPGRYLLTGTNFDHAPLMAAPERRSEIEAKLLAQLEGLGAEVYAWVVLPNHYHVLTAVAHLMPVSAVIKRLHGATSRAWNKEDDQTGQRQVWYRFSDRVIRTDRQFYQALNYVHYNPVKHGVAEDPYLWPWSSLNSYMRIHGKEWLRATWRDNPPRDFGKGWDG